MESTFFMTREDMAQFLKSPRQIRSFEVLQANSGDSVDFIIGARLSQVLTLAESPVLPEQRILTPSANVTLTDGGAGGPATLDLSDTGIVGATYGSASDTISVTVDAKGRLSAINVFQLDTDNVTEGSVNLYFTNARARSALSGGDGIDYDSGTGNIAVDATVVRADQGPAWVAATGAASRASFATYAAPAISNPPTQAEVQAIANALQTLSQRMKAIIDDTIANNVLTS